MRRLTISLRAPSPEDLITDEFVDDVVTERPEIVRAGPAWLKPAFASAAVLASVVVIANDANDDAVRLDRYSLHFDTEEVGRTSDEKLIQIASKSGAGLPFNVGFSPSDQQDFNAEKDCDVGNSAAPCIIRVRFTPDRPGPRTATLRVEGVNGDLLTEATLSGAGAPPRPALLRISPDQVNFGAAPQGETRSERFSLTNEGVSEQKIEFRITGANAESFSFDPASAEGCSDLSPNETCAFGVVFASGVAGAHEGVLEVVDSAGGVLAAANLSGSGIASAPAMLSFDPVVFVFQPTSRDAPLRHQFSLRNDGEDAIRPQLRIGRRQSDAYAISGSTCEQLAPRSACSISITFTPLNVGPHEGAIEVLGDDGKVLATAVLGGAGKAAAQQVALRPDVLRFESQEVGRASSTKIIAVTNTGDAPLRLRVSIESDERRAFRVESACNQIAPQESCRVSVSFAPRSSGARRAEVQFADASGNVLAVAPVTGFAQPLALRDVALRPASLHIDPQRVGTSTTRQISLRSPSGHRGLSFDIVPNAGQGFRLARDCRGQPDNRPCQLSLTYSPRAVGANRAQLRVKDGDAVIAVAPLSGAGAAEPLPIVQINRVSARFKPVVVGIRSNETIPFTVTNLGPGSVALTVDIVNANPPRAAFFRQTTCQTLAANRRCRIDVGFQPGAVGLNRADLRVRLRSGEIVSIATLTGEGQYRID